MPNPAPAAPKPLLDVSFSGQSVARVEHDGQPLPVELTSVVQPTDPDPRLVFTDTNGTAHIYDFASTTRTSNVAALSIRVERGYVVQPDCLLGNPDVASVEDLRAGRADGLRLQPFFLPESNFDVRTLAGRGLFARGLHYPGQVTPGNVSLLCICDGCARSFRVQSFHAGLSQLIYFYRARGHTLAVSAMTPGAPALLAPPDAESLRAFESRLPSCAACGGSFGYWNPFRCPHCERPYIDFEKHPEERPREYYGNHIYGEALQRWGDGV